MPEANPIRGAFDQTWNIREHEARADSQVDNAEAGVKCGERIIGDFWLGRCGAAQKSRFSSIRQTKQASVCDQFKAQPEYKFFASFAWIRSARGLIGRGFEVQIAPTTIAAAGHHDALADLCEVGN